MTLARVGIVKVSLLLLYTLFRWVPLRDVADIDKSQNVADKKFD